MSTNNPRSEPKLTSVPEIPKTFGDDGGHFYRYYDDLADELDEDMVKSLKSQLDGILIFAGLFAGVNSAFLALTLPEMSANPADDTNALLLQLVAGGNGSIRGPEDLPSATFAPSPAIFPVNVLFSLSLTLAVVSSFLAVIVQQWLVYYRKRSGGGAEHQRWEQLRRYLGAKRWRLEAILDDILPGLLQLALVIFCVGFVAYLRTLSKTMCYVIVGPMAIAGAILLLMGIAGAWDQWCPFKSPLSHLLQLIGKVTERQALRYLLAPMFITIRNSSIFFLYLVVASKRLAHNVKMLLIHFIDRIIGRIPRNPASLSLGKELWKSLDQLVDRALDRSGESTDHLKVVAAQRVLCTSEDFNALMYTAVNIHSMDSADMVRYFLDDDTVHERLNELCTPSQGLLAKTLSRSLIRFLREGNPVELLCEPRYRRSFDTEEPPRHDIISKRDNLSEMLSTLSSCIQSGFEPLQTHWNDSFELAFYCELLIALLHRDPTTGALEKGAPSLDDVIERFSPPQHCPQRLVALVAGMISSVNEIFLANESCRTKLGSPSSIESEALKCSAQMGFVRKFNNVGRFELEFEPADGKYWLHGVGGPDTVLGLIHSAFDSGMNHPLEKAGINHSHEKAGTTYIWLLEQLLAFSVENRRRSGLEVVFHRSVDLLCKLGPPYEGSGVIRYLQQRYCRCARVLSRCLQDWRKSCSLSFETDGYGLGKLVNCLESFVAHDGWPSHDDDILSSWLEMRDIGWTDPTGWTDPIGLTAKYKEVYPRLKAAFDEIESRMPSFKRTQNINQNVPAPQWGFGMHGQSVQAGFYQPWLPGSATNQHVGQFSQATAPPQIGQINSSGIPGSEGALMVGSVPGGGTVPVPGPQWVYSMHGQSGRAGVYQPWFPGGPTNQHVGQFSQATAPPQIGQINSSGIPGSEGVVMVGSVPEGGTGYQQEQPQFGNPSSESAK